MRKSIKALAALGVAAAVVVPAVASNAMTYSFVNPANHCTYSVTGPDLIIHTFPSPGVQKQGGISESVSCP